MKIALIKETKVPVDNRVVLVIIRCGLDYVKSKLGTRVVAIILLFCYIVLWSILPQVSKLQIY